GGGGRGGGIGLPAADNRDGGALRRAVDGELGDYPGALGAFVQARGDQLVAARDEFAAEGDDLVRHGAQQFGADLVVLGQRDGDLGLVGLDQRLGLGGSELPAGQGD